MKHKISISIDEQTYFSVLDILKSRKFRNKSNVIEYAIKKLAEGKHHDN